MNKHAPEKWENGSCCYDPDCVAEIFSLLPESTQDDIIDLIKSLLSAEQ